MFRKGKSFFILFIGIILFIITANGDDQIRCEEFITVLDRIENNIKSNKSYSNNNFSAEYDQLRFSEGLEAAVILWRNGKRDTVELAWWRSPFRTTRMVVISLFYAKYTDRDLDIFPKFLEEAKRYSAKEQKERIEEIMFIEKNLYKVIPKIKAIEAKL